MLVWNANFQIPHSDRQSAYLYAFIDSAENGLADVSFYADDQKTTLMFVKQYQISQNGNPYDALLALSDFENYKHI